MDLSNIMSSNYTTHNIFLTNKKQNIINKGSIPDRPRLTIDSDMGVNSKKIKKGVLMIIID